MGTCDTTAIASWLIDGARAAVTPLDVLDGLCDRLVGCGIPLWRAAVFVRTLHPHVTGRRFLWRLGHGVEMSELLFEGLQTQEFQDSPVARVYATGAAFRQRFATAGDAAQFPVLRELRASDGKTLYRFNTGGSVGGGVISYEVKGKQYLATTSGVVSGFFGGSGTSAVIVFTLP